LAIPVVVVITDQAVLHLQAVAGHDADLQIALDDAVLHEAAGGR
jgi:hypothetical protein